MLLHIANIQCCSKLNVAEAASGKRLKNWNKSKTTGTAKLITGITQNWVITYLVDAC